MTRATCRFVLGALACGAFAGSAAAATNGMLGFTYQGNRFEFRAATINADGSGLAIGALGRSKPVFSPDGNRELVWDFDGRGGADLYVRDVDGANERPLVPVGTGIIWNASWSPDGARIGYLLSSADNAAVAEVWTMNADGTNQTKITNDGGAKLQIDWGMTPSGAKIAYIGVRPDFDASVSCSGWQLLIMDPDGTSPTCESALAPYNQMLAFNAKDLEWSPDGTKIAMTASFCDGAGCDTGGAFGLSMGDIWVVDLAAHTTHDLTRSRDLGQVRSSAVAWAPDGATLAASAYAPAAGDLNAGRGIYTVPAAGGTMTRVTPVEPSDSVTTFDQVDWQRCTPGVTRTCMSVVPAAGGGTPPGDGGTGPSPVGIQLNVTGPGTVTSSSGQLVCPSMCTASFGPRTAETLSARPGSGARFVGWTGACGGSSSTCTLNLDADTTVNAMFELSPAGLAPGPGQRIAACGRTRTGVHHLCGTRRSDHLVGGRRRDVIEGRGGVDRLEGRGGADWILGGAGADALVGGSGGDRLDGGTGADRIVGGTGVDLLLGGAGGDTIDARDGVRDLVNCGAGRDTVRADRKDVLIGCEVRHLG